MLTPWVQFNAGGVLFCKRFVEKTVSEGNTEFTSQLLNYTARWKRKSQISTPVSLRALQDLMWHKVGIIRDEEGLISAANTLAAWSRCLPEPTDRPSYELNNLVLTARLVAESALVRKESRGAHFRSDFPKHSSEWERHITFTC